MRIFGRIKKVFILVFCVCLSIIYLILKSNKTLSELKTNELNLKMNENFSFKISFKNTPHKWKVLTNGTVIHLGNFSEQIFKTIDFIINEQKICDNFSNSSSKLIIFIESEANHFERRRAIRETWAQHSSQKLIKFKIVFILGLHHNQDLKNNVQGRILKESQTFEDIIQINTIEDFKNLTLKSIASLQWFLKTCSKSDFYFKTDDDIPIHTNNLIKTLNEHKASHLVNNSIICHKNPNLKIIRTFEMISELMRSHRNSINRFKLINDLKEKILKYKINYSELPGLYFPQYCSGFGYGFSQPVAQRLYRTALTIPYFMIEDVFITGFCRQKANIDIKDTKHLSLRPPINPSEGNCAFTDGRINANEMSIEEIRELWTNFDSKKC